MVERKIFVKSSARGEGGWYTRDKHEGKHRTEMVYSCIRVVQTP